MWRLPAASGRRLRILWPSIRCGRMPVRCFRPSGQIPRRPSCFGRSRKTPRKLLEAIREKGIHAPVYLSQEAAQEGSGLRFGPQNAAGVKDPSGVGIYTVDIVPDGAASGTSFVRRYQAATGTYPSPVAVDAYEAVRLVAQAVRKAGPNRARVRDHLSSTRDVAGVSGNISFDVQGNNRAEVRLVRLQ